MLKKMMYGSALSVLLSAGSTIAIADTAAPAAAPSPAAAPAPAAVPTDEERKKAGEYLECLGSKTGITDAPGGKTAALKLVDITQMPEVKGANPNDDGPFLKAMNEQRKKDGATGPDITEADLQKADAACTK